MAVQRGVRQSWRDATTIAYLTLDTLFWSKKTIFVLLVALMVLGLSLLGRLVLTFNWIRAPFTEGQVFATLVSTAVVHFLVTFVTLFYGTALVSEEVENRTLTYLFVRPIAKPVIMMGKFLALLWASVILVLPTMLFSYLILYARADMTRFLEDAGVLAKDVGVVLLAILAYGALFSLLGAWLKHSILAGLIYAFGWEGIVSYLPGFTRKLTITHYIQSILPHEDAASAIAMMIGSRTPVVEAIVTLLLLSTLFLSIAALLLREKEYVLES